MKTCKDCKWLQKNAAWFYCNYYPKTENITPERPCCSKYEVEEEDIVSGTCKDCGQEVESLINGFCSKCL